MLVSCRWIWTNKALPWDLSLLSCRYKPSVSTALLGLKETPWKVQMTTYVLSKSSYPGKTQSLSLSLFGSSFFECGYPEICIIGTDTMFSPSSDILVFQSVFSGKPDHWSLLPALIRSSALTHLPTFVTLQIPYHSGRNPTSRIIEFHNSHQDHRERYVHTPVCWRKKEL